MPSGKMLKVSLIVTLEVEYMITELIGVRKEVRKQNFLAFFLVYVSYVWPGI